MEDRHIIKELAILILDLTKRQGPKKWVEQVIEEMRNMVFVSYERDYESVTLHTKLIHILRECFLTHRWKDALPIVQLFIFYGNKTYRGYNLCKAGAEVLQTMPVLDQRLIHDFYTLTRHLLDVQGLDVFLDYMLYILKVGDFDTFNELVKGDHWATRKWEYPERYDYDKILVGGYIALGLYVQWKLEKQRLENQSAEDMEFSVVDEFLLSQSLVSKDVKLKNLSQNALKFFSQLLTVEGVWDIFITRYIEILEDEGKHVEAMWVLEAYANKNPENVNAYKYLYSYHQRHESEVENGDKVKILKDIARLVPSDPLVLDLCECLQKDSITAPLPYLFSLLDYVCWQTELCPWRMLANILDTIYDIRKAKKCETDVVRKSWKIRLSWWPAYHFTVFHLEQLKDDTELIFYKAVVARILCGNSCDFVKAALPKLSSHQASHIHRIKLQH